MEASTVPSTPKFEPDIESIKKKLLKKGIYPTPKIIHSLRKKQIQKHNRKLTKLSQTQPLTPSQKQALLQESHFQAIRREYTTFTKAIRGGDTLSTTSGLLVGMPWEGIERVKLKEIATGSQEFKGQRLNTETLKELKQFFEDGLNWVLDNDIEFEGIGDGSDMLKSENQWQYDPTKRRRNDKEEIRFLVDRLSGRDVTVRDWKLAKIMKQSRLLFSEGQLMKIVEGLGNKGKWEQAMAVVEWVFNNKERRNSKSRFVYTKLLSVLRIERRPTEALRIFNLMREDADIYPDMAAYHVIAVTLGQTGSLKELLKVVECMRQKPSKGINNRCYKRWDPVLEPDIVVYNSILNACVPTKQWKGVSWVFQQLRKSGLKPNGATYGLAMEVMLNSGKYDLVHELFRKMNRSGEAPKALTYKVLVRAFWEEGKVNEAVEAVRDMEQRGVVGTGSLYYELACCLCHNGRWRDAMLEVKKMTKLCHSKPLEITFTGLIMSSLDGGHVNDCISIFEFMKTHCAPNIGTIKTMLKVYGRNDLFSKAKELFEEIKVANGDGTSLVPDAFTYSSMLEASATALQWEYFELVYKEMTLAGYQLDQSRHASLLVEASRAGKCHLLEHAFDSALEAGKIPHHSLFTEMVFQATAQENYERAVILVNTLALAPFQINERQWINLFQENGEKIPRDSLEKLLDALRHSDVVSEPTAANLSSTLHSLCGRGRSEYLSSSSTDSGIGATDGSCSCLDSGSREIAHNNRPEMDKVPLDNIAYSDFSVDCSNTDEESSAETGVLLSPRRVNGTANRYTNLKEFGDGEASGAPGDCLDGPLKDLDEMEFKLPLNQVDDDDDDSESELPSAEQILEAWKENRKGKLFFPFQLRHKNNLSTK